jgi:hypothetical protein
VAKSFAGNGADWGLDGYGGGVNGSLEVGKGQSSENVPSVPRFPNTKTLQPRCKTRLNAWVGAPVYLP